MSIIRWIKTPKALTPDQITNLYAMAEKFGVGVITGGGSGSPSRGPAEWSVNGGWRATAKFLAAAALAFGATQIAEPKYPPVPRWTDKNRWEKD